MLIFKKEKKEELLQGRTIRYLAKNKVACTEVHLINVLNGKTPCSYLLAKNILEAVDNTSQIEDFFTEKEKK